MPKSRLVLAIIFVALVVLLLGEIGIIRFNLSSIYSELLNAMGVAISTIFLALIISMDLIFVGLIARTPNRWWQP